MKNHAMLQSLWLLLVLVFSISSPVPLLANQTSVYLKDHPDLSPYLHPRALIESPSPVELQAIPPPLPPLTACQRAITELKARGVIDPLICEVHWIAGGVSGYLVDALGTWQHEGKRFTCFRVGVSDRDDCRDGGLGPAGSIFRFLARGQTEDKTVRWYPPPGPDASEADDRLPYEYLLDRDRFETLEIRYRLKPPQSP